MVGNIWKHTKNRATVGLNKNLGKTGQKIEQLIWDGTHRVISDKVHRLLVTLSYFRPDRFVQLLSLIPILILLLYLLVSIDLEYTGLLGVGLLEEATKL